MDPILLPSTEAHFLYYVEQPRNHFYQVGSVLSEIYEGDEGLHSPNLKNEYQLKVGNDRLLINNC